MSEGPRSLGVRLAFGDVFPVEMGQGDLIGEEAARTGKSVREVVLEHDLIPEERLDEIMSTQNFLHPRYSGRTYEPSDRGLPEDPRTFVSERC
jgi:aspartate ammonia-lyase